MTMDKSDRLLGTGGARHECMFPLIPLVMPGVASLGKSALESFQNATHAKSSTAQDPNGIQFDDLLKKLGAVSTTNNSAQLTPKEIHVLTHKLMKSPELQAAMGGKSPESIGLQIAPDGTVSTATAGGGRQNLILSPTTQALAQQVGLARAV